MGLVAGLNLGLALAYVLFSSGPDSGSVGALRPSGAPLRPTETTTLESVSDPTPGGDRQEVAPSALAAAPPISEERLQAMLARIEVEQTEHEIWTAELSGQVTDTEGVGVADVILRAGIEPGSFDMPGFFKFYFAQASNTAHERPPERSLEDAVREAAQFHAISRSYQFEACTDPEGHYRFEGLPQAEFGIRAYKVGFAIERRVRLSRSEIPAGARVDFVARPVLNVPVRVLLPGGGLAAEAIVVASVEQNGRARTQNLSWTPDNPNLGFLAGEVELSAVTGVPPGSYPVDLDAADFRAPPISIKLVDGAPIDPVVLQLEGRTGIRGRVDFAEDRIERPVAYVVLLRLTAGQGVDLDVLARAKSRASAGDGGEFAFLDLTAGPYAVGIKRTRNGHVTTHKVVEVGSAIVRCDIEVPPIDPQDFLLVRALGPRGKPLDGLSFDFQWEDDDDFLFGGMRDADGNYYLAIPQQVRSAYFGDAPGDGLLSLDISHREFGSKFRKLRGGQRELTVSFSPPAQLEVVITGNVNSSILGRVAVGLMRVAEESTSRGQGEREELRGETAVRFEGLVPGAYRLSLLIRPRKSGGSRAIVAMLEVDLGSGKNSVRMVLPQLHGLEIIVPGARERSFVGLSRIAEGEGAWTGSWRSYCDADGHALFEDVPVGAYIVQARGEKRGKMRIEVPCGAVVFDPDGD